MVELENKRIRKVSLAVEIFTHKARIRALKKRIKKQHEFVERCQQKQRATHWKAQGLTPANTYDSLAIQRSGGKYKKGKRQRRKADLWHNYFCWSDPAMFPCTIIKDAEQRIEKLEAELAEFMKIEKEQSDE